MCVLPPAAGVLMPVSPWPGVQHPAPVPGCPLPPGLPRPDVVTHTLLPAPSLSTKLREVSQFHSADLGAGYCETSRRFVESSSL